MKKMYTLLLTALMTSAAYAQVQLDIKTVDLSGNGKSRAARFVGASQPAGTDEIKLTFSTKSCETRDLGATIAFEGTNHNFEHVIFDNQFHFKRLDKETVLGLPKALAIAPVLGKGVEVNEPFGYVQGASREGTWLEQHKYYSQVYGSPGTSIYASGCLERLEAKRTGVKILFPGEGFLYSNPLYDGVVTISYAAIGNTEAVKMMTRIYGDDGNKKMESTFDVPYKNFAARIVKYKRHDGVYDYIMILQPTKGYNKYGVKVAQTKSNPLEFEYIHIDGKTLEIKERFPFTAVNSQWCIEQVIEQDGALYLMGSSAATPELTNYAYGAYGIGEGGNNALWVRIDELENFQVMKVQNGKVGYINAITPDDMKKVQQSVAGSKGSNSPVGYFRLQEIKFIANKIYITGQNNEIGKTGDDRKQEFMMVLGETGKIEHLLYVPKSSYTDANMFVSQDNKTLYWAIYDYAEFSITAQKKEPTQIRQGFVVGGNDHTITNKRRDDDGPQLQLVKIDLPSFTASALQKCGEDDYTLFDDAPVLYATNKEVVFLGVSGGKKDRVTKFIKLAL